MRQLVTDRVLVLNTAMRPGQRLIGPKQVEARYGVPPSAWCCRTGLAGDPSDGIKGIPGIGPVTAARLLAGGLALEDLAASGRPAGAASSYWTTSTPQCAAGTGHACAPTFPPRRR